MTIAFVVGQNRLAHARGGMAHSFVDRSRRARVVTALLLAPALAWGGGLAQAATPSAAGSPVTMTAWTAGGATRPGAVAASAPAPAAAPAARVARPMRWADYRAQAVVWSRGTCTSDVRQLAAFVGSGSGSALECARLRVPQDWSALPKGHTTLHVTRVRRAKAAADRRATRVLFVNPGGPGVAADWLAPTVAALAPAVRATHDIVAVDPRGTGGSSPASCETVSDGIRDYRDPTPAEISAQQRAVQRTVAACARRIGPRLAQLSTMTTVRDHDLVRSLLRVDTLDFYGVSAGTWLGARYADLYPTRVGRIVLDSNTEFSADWRRSFAWQPLGFQRRFDAQFLPWLARAHSTYRLGGTASAARASISALRRAAARGRLFGLTPADLDQAIVENLYTDAGFEELATALAALHSQAAARPAAARPAAARSSTDAAAPRSGAHPDAASGAAERAAARLKATANLAAGTEDTVFMAVQCNDSAWVHSPQSYVVEGLRLGRRYPLLGYTWVTSPCAYWPYPPTPVARVGAARRVPMLMVQTEFDPATPLEGARAAHAARPETRLLTVTGQGNHGAWLGENPCVERTVGLYLTTGRMPAADTTCAGLPLPGEEPLKPARSAPRAQGAERDPDGSGSGVTRGSTERSLRPVPGTPEQQTVRRLAQERLADSRRRG